MLAEWGKSFFAVVFLLGKVSEEGGEHRGWLDDCE